MEDRKEVVEETVLDEESTGFTEFECIYWDGNLPTAQGKVGKALEGNMCSQLQKALDMLRFFSKPDADFKLLDLETTITPCIVAVPGATHRQLCVIYGLGTGAAATGIKDNDLRSSFLALTGEYLEGVSMPNVLTLPPSLLAKQGFKIPSETAFEEECMKENTKTVGWFKALEVNVMAEIGMLMPVPAFLILDAIDGDIDAIIAYERWQAMKENLRETEGLN